MERVVVYGLLRKGQSMAHMLSGAEFLGTVELDGFELYHLGSYPGAVGGDGKILGEVYAVKSLKELDRAEKIHEDPPLYRRVLVEALGEPSSIYVYARPLTDSFRIDSGDWANPY